MQKATCRTLCAWGPGLCMPSNRLQQVGDNDKVINDKNAFQEA